MRLAGKADPWQGGKAQLGTKRAIALGSLLASLACALPAPALASHDDKCRADEPPNPDGSELVWSEPGCLSAIQADAEGPQVAIDKDGGAVAVWRLKDSRDPKKYRVQFSMRPPGGTFEPAPSPPEDPDGPGGEPPPPPPPDFNPRLDKTFLSSAGADVGTYIRMDMNEAGDTIVVWEVDEGNGKTGIRSAFRPAGGEFGAEQVVANAGSDRSWVEPEVGIDGERNATVIYHRKPAPFGTAIGPLDGGSEYVSASRPGDQDSTWGDQVDLAPNEFPPGEPPDRRAPYRYNETYGSLTVDENGDRLATVASQRSRLDLGPLRQPRPGPSSRGGASEGRANRIPPNTTNPARQVVYELDRPAGAARWGFKEIGQEESDENYTTHAVQRGERTTSAYTQGRNVWARGDSFFKFKIGGEDFYNTSAANDTRFGEPPAGPNTPTSGSAFEIDSTGDTLALWSDGSSLHANRLSGGGSRFFPSGFDRDPVPGNGSGARTRPALAAYGDGQVVATFKQQVGGDEHVSAAVRPADDGTERGGTKFDDPVQLTIGDNADVEDEGADSPGGGQPGTFAPKRGTGPKVAANSRGEAVAVWSIGDGTNKVLQFSFLTPRDDPVIPPPPPPKPRPRPAVLSPIDVARPFARDQANVLIANVPGNPSRLEWSFQSKDEPPIVGKVEGGELQRTVRLRLPSTDFEAKVRVVNADGSIQDFSRSFSSLKDSSSSNTNTKDVLEGLKKIEAPPVFATGKKEVLTGQSNECSPTTVVSDQQKQSGCFKPLEKIVDIPSLERGAIKEVGDALGLDERKKELMDKATQLTDGYVAQGTALINDKFPVTPSQGAQVVSIFKAKTLISAKAELPVGNATYDPKKGFNLKLDPKKVKIPLGKLPNPPKLPSLAGLEIVGDYNVDLDKQEAKIRASVKFPEAFKKNGVRLENEVVLRATPNEIIVDEVRVGPIDLNVAALKVNKFQIKYTRQGNQWDGQGKACVIGTACLDMIPPAGGVQIKDGTLSRAGATLGFPPPGLPLFTGVNLERVGFGIGLRPTRIFGSARVGVGKIIKLDGRVFIAFPDSQTPFNFDRETAGTGFPNEFYGRRSTTPTFGASAEAFVDVPIIGETKLGQAYALYEYPDYAAFGGSYSADVLDVVSVSGGVSAEADFGDGLFNIHGNVRACIKVITDICQGATGNVSRGRNGTGGAGACVEFAGLNIGGGVQWARLSEPFIWPIDGCKWSRFRATVREGAVNAKAAAAAKAKGAATVRAKAPPAAKAAGMSAKAKSAATSYTVNIEKGKPSQIIQLDGVGSSPTIRVRGPGGQLVEVKAGEGFKRSSDSTIRALRFENKFAKFAVVGFQNAKPGRYTIETLPGSAAVSGVKQATDPPDAKVTGKVSGKGRTKRLRYDIRPRENQKVIFQEKLRNGATQFIGSTTKSGKGSLRFKSFPGFGRRKIVAQFELSGIPTERRTVTTFTPQSPLLKRPRRLRARHRGNSLRVSWRKVSGARTYEVAAGLSSRRMVFKTTRRTKATLRVPRYLKGKVTVRAMDREFRQSRLSARRFGGRGKQPSPFRPLLSCRITKTRIICTERNQRCGGRTPTISASKGRRTVGTRRSDVIAGSSGADRIDGRGGNDIICAGGGNDRITGGAGNDLLQGEAGKDRITGGVGNDRIDGGASADRIKGGSGNDRISGGSGNDVVVGGAGRGRDTIDTGSGNDRVETRDRNAQDRVNCGPGRDQARVDRVDRSSACERLRRG